MQLFLDNGTSWKVKSFYQKYFLWYLLKVYKSEENQRLQTHQKKIIFVASVRVTHEDLSNFVLIILKGGTSLVLYQESCYLSYND